MTQKQNWKFAYTAAGISVVVSSLLWTLAIANIAYSNTYESKENVWNRNLSYLEYSNVKTKSLEASLINIEDEIDKNELHESAPVNITVETREINSEEDNAKTENELEKWGLQRSFTLQIPSLNIRVPVLLPSITYWESRKWGMLEEQMQIGLLKGAVAYPHSVLPGEMGSIIIAGHSSPPDERAAESIYGNIFRSLPSLKEGDAIYLIDDGVRITYIVQESYVIPVSETEILKQQKDEKILKLMTCFPIGTTKDRLIVTAKRIGLHRL
ncbi:sortase [Candidatus Peregrinibacteria bacterium]|jgi:LPXTG-site transpeptidase (sortase) family protein|nr:sortase [Candidatus Peregrinibacteria bacterium]MBT3598434.1 sortase [Candidatus Peregrinibacteria bacterium]MBT4367733.1 sortase [Candidatus Peregrinibacteria bacterium]MBT4585268.1 sortase [Candidatus Peregrinibacteria bacterium]MBT6730897.1 sortase [Candidatus Peregrinibacteria bacterium]